MLEQVKRFQKQAKRQKGLLSSQNCKISCTSHIKELPSVLFLFECVSTGLVNLASCSQKVRSITSGREVEQGTLTGVCQSSQVGNQKNDNKRLTQEPQTQHSAAV